MTSTKAHNKRINIWHHTVSHLSDSTPNYSHRKKPPESTGTTRTKNQESTIDQPKSQKPRIKRPAYARTLLLVHFDCSACVLRVSACVRRHFGSGCGRVVGWETKNQLFVVVHLVFCQQRYLAAISPLLACFDWWPQVAKDYLGHKLPETSWWAQVTRNFLVGTS